MPPPRPRAHELLVMEASKRLNIPCVPGRLSIITRPLNGRQACHYCGQCNRGCAVHANFSSTNVLLAPALATRKLTLMTNAMVREVTLDERGRATGVSYIDKTDGRDKHVSARVVVLAASALESARLLLNSKSSKFPNGLANGSGKVGKDITDTTGSDVAGFIPKLVGRTIYNDDGVGGGHVYMPWWGDNAHLDFPRGYHIEVWGGRGQPGAGFFGGMHRYPPGGGYGATLKDNYRKYWGTTIGFSGRGEMIHQRRLLLRARSRREGRVRDPGAEIPLALDRPRVQPGATHAADFPQPVEAMGGQVFSPCPPAIAASASATAAASSTSWGEPRWGPTRRRRCSTPTARRTRCPISLSPTAGPSSRKPTRIRRGRSWRCRCVRPSSSPSR